MPGNQFWFSLKSSKSMKIMRSHPQKSQYKSLRVQTLQRMTTFKEQQHLRQHQILSTSPSEQELVDIISKAQCRRYESQRSPYPSPAAIRHDSPDTHEVTFSEEDNLDTPTNNRRPACILNDDDTRDLLEASLNSSTSSCDSPNHLVPPGSPGLSLKPNRRSVEALKKLIASDKDGPYPLIISPPDGGYWIQNGEYEASRGDDGTWHAPEIDTEHFRLDNDSTSLMYGRHFAEKSHKNFYVNDSKFGAIVFSLMIDSDVNCDPLIRMILRTQDETYYKVYPSAQLSRKLEPEEYLGVALASLNDGEPVRVEGLTRIHSKKATEIIQKFDEHSVVKQHKIGVIYQKFGQTTEEEMFCNNVPSPAFKEFLNLLGDTVELKDFERYRGGLDNKNGQTGDRSVYTEYKGQEIMFHVSTMLPYDPSDRQQVARKRHIGNDIVLVIFQDSNTPYSPDCVRSRFLHAHIVVQVEQDHFKNSVYKGGFSDIKKLPFNPMQVAVAAKEEVPDFAPPLPTPAVFSRGIDFREWLLTKILNAEAKCYEAPAFRKLSMRTRSQLFIHLLRELSGSKEITENLPKTSDKRKSLGYEMIDQVTESPRRRRMTLSGFFPPRRKISGGPGNLSPKLSKHKKSSLTTSTPDLSIIGEEPPINHDRNHMMIIKESSTKRRFTLRGKASRKNKASISENPESNHHHGNKKHHPQYDEHSERSSMTDTTSLATSLNWSVPSDLPGVVTQMSNQMTGKSSLEDITFSLYGGSSSNPNITDSATPSTIYDAVSSPGSGGPRTCDVAIQVDQHRNRQLFTFPTPPQSVSPILPLDAHPNRKNRTKNFSNYSELHQHLTEGGVLPSPSSLDNRQSGIFPFVPEEDEMNRDEDSSDSNNENPMTMDPTYKSMLQQLQQLASEVSVLREQQIRMYQENIRLQTSIQKWKSKYKHIKSQTNTTSEKNKFTKIEQNNKLNSY